MYGPFSLRITTLLTRMVLPLKWAVGSSIPASVNFARPLSDDNAQILRVTVAYLRVQEDLAGTSAALRSLDEHFHGYRLVDPVNGFLGGYVHFHTP